MGFKDSKMVFHESKIQFVQPVATPLKEAVGESKVSELVDDVTDIDFSLDKDLFDKALEKKIAIESTHAGNSRQSAKGYKKEYKRLKKEHKKSQVFVDRAEAENVVVHGIFDEKNANYQRLKKKFKSTDWSNKPEEKRNAKFRLNEVKKEAAKAYMAVEQSNEKLDNIALSRQQMAAKYEAVLDQKNLDIKEAKKHEKKVAIYKTVLSIKDGIVNGTSQDCGNLVEAGQHGVVGTVLRAINPVEIVKTKIKAILAAFGLGVIKSVGSFLLEFMLAIFVLISIFASLIGLCAPVINAVAPANRVLYNSHYSAGQIEDILLERGWEWQYDYDIYGERIESSKRKVSTLPVDKQNLIRFALSKVGGTYSQANRTSGWAYDCSSLAYYTEASIGKDITCSTAAGQAKKMYREGKTLTSSAHLEIGDLIYYGGHDNGRFLGIYHVAIYVGNGYCVEAYNTEKGIIYGSLRPNNVVMICRP